MSNARDSQFARSARLLCEEMIKQAMIPVHPKALEVLRPLIERLIARWGYDLVTHCFDTMNPIAQQCCATTEDMFRGIPDMDRWPVGDKNGG